MTSDDICKILEASKGTNVSKIKIGPILFEFGNLTNKEINLNNVSTVPFVSDVNTTDGTKGQGETTDPKDIANEFILAQTMASDPEEFEKMLREVNAEG